MHPLLAQSNTLKAPFSHHWIGSGVLLSNYSDLSTLRIWLRLFKEQRKRLCFCFSNVLLGGIIAIWHCTVSLQHSLPLEPLIWDQKKKTHEKQNSRRIETIPINPASPLYKCGSLPLNFNANESHPRKGMGHCLVMLMKPPSLSITAVSASRAEGRRKVAFSQLEGHMWHGQAIGGICWEDQVSEIS